MTEPSQRALDHAARKAGFHNFGSITYHETHSIRMSVTSHARTLDELWAIKPPKTRGELFAEELNRRWTVDDPDACHHLARMIDEGWEPKDD